MSGDDTEGFFQFTAWEKAKILALVLGIVGAPIGGIVGAIAGIDESVVVTPASPDEMILILNKLKSYARYVDEIPQDIKISPPAAIRESSEVNSTETPPLSIIQSGNDAEGPVRNEKINRIHVSITPGYYVSSGIGDLKGVLKTIGFNSSKYYSSGWFGGPFTVTYPRNVKNPRSDIDVKLEYSLNKNLAFGAAYSPLREYGASGRRVITPSPDYREFEVETYIVGFYSGHTYLLTASYFPIPDAFLKKRTIKITAGIGYGRSKMDFFGSSSEYVYEHLSSYSLPYDHKSFSKNAVAALFLAELIHFFNERWSLGVNANYKYVAV